MFDRIRSKVDGLRQSASSQAGLRRRSQDNALRTMPWEHLHAKIDGAVSACCVAERAKRFGALYDTPGEELFHSEPMWALRC